MEPTTNHQPPSKHYPRGFQRVSFNPFHALFLIIMAIPSLSLTAQTQVEFHIDNYTGCDLKVAMRVDATGNVCANMYNVGSCGAPDGQTTVCTFTLPANHEICALEVINWPPGVGHTSTLLGCYEYYFEEAVDLCNGTGNLVQLEISNCHTYRFRMP